MRSVPSQCKLCVNFNLEESLCSIHEQLPGEYGRESVVDCPSFIEKGTKDADDLKLLLQYVDEDPDNSVDASISRAVDRILSDYEYKYKVLVVGIARRKIKSIIKMVDIVDAVIDKLGDEETLADMASSQAIRLLSELNHSMNNDLTFIMKLVNPDTKLSELQMWIDARSVTVNGSSPATDMKADEILKLSGASRDKIRDAFDALLHQINDNDDDIVDVLETEEIEDETSSSVLTSLISSGARPDPQSMRTPSSSVFSCHQDRHRHLP